MMQYSTQTQAIKVLPRSVTSLLGSAQLPFQMLFLKCFLSKCYFYFIKSAGANYAERYSKTNTIMTEYQAHKEPSWSLQRADFLLCEV